MPFVAFFCFLVGLGLGVLALWFDRRSERHWAMATAAAVYACWSFCMIFVYGLEDEVLALSWYRISIAGSLFVIPPVYWFYLHLSGFSFRSRVVLIGLDTAWMMVLYWQFFLHGFLFERFSAGAWGNVGTADTHPVWYMVASLSILATHLAMVVLMFRNRSRARSFRLRRQFGANAVALIVTAVLFGVAWYLETALGWPPLDFVVAGFYLIGVNFYLMSRYRFLQKDRPLLAGQVSGLVEDAIFLLDDGLRIVSLNPTAEKLIQGEASTGLFFPDLFDQPEILAQEWNAMVLHRDRIENVAVSRKGTVIVVSLSPHLDQFGDVVGVVAVIGNLPFLAEVNPESGLTQREKEIVNMLVQGFGNKAIASALFISPGTVKNHVFNIYRKLGAGSRLDLLNKLNSSTRVS